MNFLTKILFLLISSALMGALTAPWLYALLHQFEALSFPFDKILNRSVLIWVILFLIFFRKSLFTIPLNQLGLNREKGWKQELGYGVIFGLLSISVLYLLLFSLGARTLDVDIFSFKFVGRLGEYSATAFFVGFFEEIFFRGFVFYGLLQTQRVWVAVVNSSLFYSVTHFLKAESFDVEGSVSILYSLKSLLNFLEPLAHFWELMPHFLGLFLIGVIFAYACIKTKRLYFSIGLHACWVFWMRADTHFMDYTYLSGEEWFFGDGKLINGMLGWCFLIYVLIAIHYFVPFKKERFFKKQVT